MQEIDIATIKKRSIKGVFSLVSRSFLIQLIGQIVTFLLTVYLSPGDYGLFFLVSTVMVFFAYFSDIGLAAALIQKKDDLTNNDLKTTFTIQQILVVIVMVVGVLLTPVIKNLYSLNDQGTILYLSLIAAFFFSSLKTIPSILLERSLQFNKLIIPDIVETLGFNITALYMAINGFGVMSFTYAVLIRGILGVIAVYIVSPWRISIGINKESARSLLSFGLPFQLNSLLALAKDNLLFLYLGTVLSPSALGFMGVAQKWAYIPLRLVMDNLIRITFPSFSRLADSPEYLGKAIEKTLFSIVFFIFPTLTGMVILMPHFISIFPKYEKWEPALLSLAFFAGNAILSSISTPLTNALNAIGKIKITLYLMVFWTVATWVLTPFLVNIYGFDGVSMASFIISLSVVLVGYVTKKYIKFSVGKIILFPLIATVCMGLYLYYVSPLLISNLVTLFIAVITGGLIYTGIMYLLAREIIKSDIRMIRENLKK